METVGHLTRKMLERSAHRSSARKLAALDISDHARFVHAAATQDDLGEFTQIDEHRETVIGEWVVGGRQEDRTPDLCVANAALSQLS